MKQETEERESAICTVRSIAPEDISAGCYVAVLEEREQIVPFLCSPADWELAKGPMYLQTIPRSSGEPMRVEMVCLPFVFVKRACGRHRTLDLRRYRIARLPEAYAEHVWKAKKRRMKALKQNISHD